MGQTVSTAVPYKSNVFYDYEDFSSRFSKLTVSTLTIPMVIIAFPVLNAYIFTEDELTGVKLMDGMIGGLLGIVGCEYPFDLGVARERDDPACNRLCTRSYTRPTCG